MTILKTIDEIFTRQIDSNREKLNAALKFLGEKYVLHRSNSPVKKEVPSILKRR